MGEVYKHIEYFSSKTYLHSATLDQFLAPIIGIFASLYNGIMRLEDNPQYEQLQQMLERVNAFDEPGLAMLRRL